MKKTILILALLLMVSAFSVAEEARLMRYPDIHNDQIVFVYGGDLWIVSSNGGVARQLTTHPGIELNPKFSPDGKQIAFSGWYDGNVDIFVVPVTGGEPKRLTYHPGNDQIVDWYPDGKSILFRSIRNSVSFRFSRLHKVSIDGSTPELLVLPEGELSSFNADASKIAFNRYGREARTWKRYRGGMAQDIWVYDFKANSVVNVTDNPATDSFPMWQGNIIYFMSDREETMKLNLYGYDVETKATTKLTNNSEYDVKWPSQGPGAIVFQNGGFLNVLDLATKQTRKVPVEIYSDSLFARPRLQNVQAYIQDGGISPTGKRAVVEARGDIFTIPAKKGEIRNLTDTQGVRERTPAWSPDGKWIAYVSDLSGEFQVYIRLADGTGEAKQLTKGLKTQFRNLFWSPDSKKIMFSDVTSSLYHIDIEGGDPVKVFDMRYSGSTSWASGNWSSDSNWITYSQPDKSGAGSIYLYSLKENKSYRVTSKLTDDVGPAFDADGKYLYWIARREFNHGFDQFDLNYFHYNASKVVVATLDPDTANPFGPESDEEEVKEEKKAEEKKDEKPEDDKKDEDKKDEKKEDEDKSIKVVIEGLEERMVNLPIPDGNYGNITSAKGMVFFTAGSPVPGAGGAALHVFDLKKRELETVMSGIGGYALSADGKKIVYVQRGSYGIIDAKPKQKPGSGKLNLAGLQMTVDYRAEWKQIYNDAWRLFRDMFYDPNMHGVDWAAMKKRYEVMLPYIAHRDDLNYIIGELIGELNTGHTYRFGGEYPRVQRVNVGVLACDFEADPSTGFYKISKIYRGHSWDPNRRSPLVQPGLNVKEGDYLIAIKGQELKYPENPLKHLVNTAGKTISVTVNSEPKSDGARDIEVQPIAGDQVHRYIDWVMTNIEKVDKASGGKIGYIQVPDTGFGGWEWFNRMFFSQVDKEALIVDARYNSGGFTPFLMMERLARKFTNLGVTRYSEAATAPGASHFGPKVCLTNGWAGSGGDNFPFQFRHLGLGPVIGTRTWGGLVGYNPGAINPLVDNGGVAVPMVAFVNDKGEWDVENKGVTPDVVLDNSPDQVINGHDPQLEKGIEMLLKAIEEQKNLIPQPPKKYPIK